MTDLPASLPPGYATAWPGIAAHYSYSPYATSVRLYCWIARGMNEHRDPDWRLIWAPNADAARLLALQDLAGVTVDPRPARMVEPPGLAHGSEAKEVPPMHHEAQFLRQEAERLLATRARIMPVAKEDARVAHWLAEFEARIDELLSLADAEAPPDVRGPVGRREMVEA